MAENVSISSSPRKSRNDTKAQRNSNSLKDYIDSAFTENPQQLEDLVSASPELTKLARKIHENLSKADSDNFDASTMELAIRHLVSKAQIMEPDEESYVPDPVDYSSLLSKNPNDVNIANLQITELQRQITSLRKSLESQRRETTSVKRELDSERQRNTRLNKEKEDLNSKHAQEVSNLHSKIQDLEYSLEDQNDRFRSKNSDKARLEKRLRDTEDELEVTQKEYMAARRRLEEKNQEINDLRVKNQLQKTSFDQQIREQTESQMMTSSAMIHERGITENNTRKKITKLVKKSKLQERELNAVIAANHRAEEIIGHHEQALAEYADREVTFEDDLQTANDDNRELTEKLEKANKKIEGLESLIESRTEELTELRDVVSECLDYLEPRYSSSIQELPETVHMLSSTRIDPETHKTLVKLTAIVDGLTRFVVQLVNGEHPDIKLIQKNPHEPIINDGTLKLDIINEISSIREDLADVVFSSAEEDPVMAYLTGFNDTCELKSTEDFSASTVIAAVCSKCREFTKFQVSELNKIRNILPFACTDAELPTAVADYILELQPVFEQLNNILTTTLHYHGSTEDIFKSLCKYVEETASMINDLDNNVRPLIGFSGKITTIPNVIAEALTDMKGQIDDYQRGISKELTRSMIQADKEKSGYKRKIDELDTTVQRNQDIIDTLQTQLNRTSTQLQASQTSCEDIAVRNMDASRTIEELTDANNALEATKDTLIKEREHLEDRFKQQQKKHDQLVDDAIENQKKLNDEEIDRLKKMYEGQIDDLSNKIAKIAKKLQSERQNSREKTNLYNELSTRTRDEIRNLKNEKADLEYQLEESGRLKSKVTKLQTKLSNERSRSIELENTISRLSAPASPVPSPRGTSRSRQTPVSSPIRTSQEQLTVATRDITYPSDLTNTTRSASMDAFTEQLGEELNKFLKKDINWTRKRILTTVTAIVNKIEELENEVRRRSSQARMQPLKEWENWANSLLEKYSQFYRDGMDSEELRGKITDIVAMSPKKKMQGIVDSLREQKQILINGMDKIEDDGEKKEPTFSDIVKVGLFIAASNKNSTKSTKSSPRKSRNTSSYK